MVKKVDHIGVAVNNLEESVKFYEEILGLKLQGIETVEEQKGKSGIFTNWRYRNRTFRSYYS